MNLWIAFFRGINVGGRNILPMKALVAVLEDLGCSNVATYIQSGNVVLYSKHKSRAALRAKIQSAVAEKYSFEPAVLLLTKDQLESARMKNPFPKGVAEPSTLHLYFLADNPGLVDHEKLEQLRSPTEQVRLIDNVLYLHAPDGIGRSKLAAKIEKCIGVPTTARNWRTLEKVLRLADDMSLT